MESNGANSSDEWVLAAAVLSVLVTILLLARLRYSLSRLRRIACRSEFIADAESRELINQVWIQSGALAKPRVAVSAEVSVSVTFDAGEVCILLPESWQSWDSVKLQTVLTHEMAHVKRGDSANLLLASVTTCVFWFHPLSWFLRRQLSVLAEEACDEAVLTTTVTPEQYANFLIAFARDVQQSNGRLVAGATAVVRNSRIQRRIERLFADSQHMQRGQRLFAGLAFLLFAPAFYTATSARFDAPGELAVSQPKKPVWVNWEQIVSLSAGDAASLKAALEVNPEDLASRMELLVYFAHDGQEAAFVEQMLWFIRHHPSIETLPRADAMFRPQASVNEKSRAEMAAAWEAAVASHEDSPDVLLNAATFLEVTNPERGLELLREAEAMDPGHAERYEQPIAMIYAAAEMTGLHTDGMINIHMSAQIGAILRGELESSSIPGLLAKTGLVLTSFSAGNEAQSRRGLQLIQQAIELDPGNAKWAQSLEYAKAGPEREEAYRQLERTGPLRRGAVRIASDVAEANLISKTEPSYPPQARSAGIQGIVEFTVTVGPKGKIQAIDLVQGDTLLAEAAMKAVQEWINHPAMVDGAAVPFVTQVMVPFKLE